MVDLNDAAPMWMVGSHVFKNQGPTCVIEDLADLNAQTAREFYSAIMSRVSRGVCGNLHAAVGRSIDVVRRPL